MREQSRRLENQGVCPNYSTTYTKGTNLEYLFYSINEKTKIEALRKKSLYPKYSEKNKNEDVSFIYVNKLADFIYKKCFNGQCE